MFTGSNVVVCYRIFIVTGELSFHFMQLVFALSNENGHSSSFLYSCANKVRIMKWVKKDT